MSTQLCNPFCACNCFGMIALTWSLLVPNSLTMHSEECCVNAFFSEIVTSKALLFFCDNPDMHFSRRPATWGCWFHFSGSGQVHNSVKEFLRAAQEHCLAKDQICICFTSLNGNVCIKPAQPPLVYKHRLADSTLKSINSQRSEKYMEGQQGHGFVTTPSTLLRKVHWSLKCVA